MKISIDEAATLLANDGVVAIPTETVYGLAAYLQSEKGVRKIYTTKNRPQTNPLIIHVKDLSEVKSYINEEIPELELLASSFWPGPLTLVLPVIIEKVPSIVRSGLHSAGFRVPAHPLTQELLKKISPLVAPSANLSGKPSATCLEHVENDFGKHFPAIDGGICNKGVESTILLYTDEKKWKVGRLGAISTSEIEKVLGYSLEESLNHTSSKTPQCPGQSFAHYAPEAKMYLSHQPYSSETSKQITTVLGFEDRTYSGAKKIISLGRSDDPSQVAQRLYDCLRSLDRDEIQEIWVDMNFPSEGLWKTIIERITRASQK